MMVLIDHLYKKQYVSIEEIIDEMKSIYKEVPREHIDIIVNQAIEEGIRDTSIIAEWIEQI